MDEIERLTRERDEACARWRSDLDAARAHAGACLDAKRAAEEELWIFKGTSGQQICRLEIDRDDARRERDTLRRALAHAEETIVRLDDQVARLRSDVAYGDAHEAQHIECWTDEAYQAVVRERDEARAETARLRRLLNMAEDELVAADDHGRREAKRADNVEAEVEALKAERDEARAEVEKLSESAKAAWEAECVMREQRDRYHAEWKQERQEVERLRAEAAPMNEHFNAGYRDGARDAYRRGAEAMREACAREVVEGRLGVSPSDMAWLNDIASDVRALPIPEKT